MPKYSVIKIWSNNKLAEPYRTDSLRDARCHAALYINVALLSDIYIIDRSGARVATILGRHAA